MPSNDLLVDMINQQIAGLTNSGAISDGYHTFDELYYQRMMLFSMICRDHREVAWKSTKHHDGTMYENYFIVGITTPAGDFTYHYHEQHWGVFDVKEIGKAPEWDGHTGDDIVRLMLLEECKILDN